MRIIKIILVLILFIASPVWARTTHYVGKTSSGANDGSSWANKWAYTNTFQSATNWCSTATYPKSSPSCDNLIGAGDTVYIDGGSSPSGITYDSTAGEYGMFRIYQGGVSGYPITIGLHPSDSNNNYKVIIDNDFGGAATQGGIFTNKSYVTISGEVSGQRRMLIRDMNGAGVDFDNTKGASLRYVEVTNTTKGNTSTYANVYFEVQTIFPTPTDYNEVAYCYLHDPYIDLPYPLRGKNVKLGGGADVAVVSEYGSYRIHHNEFFNAQGDHIEVGVSSVDIYNNIFHNDSSTIHYDTVHFFNNYYRVWNNTIYGSQTASSEHFYFEFHCADTGYPLCSALGHIVLYNNLFYEPITSVAITNGHHNGHNINDETINDIYVLNNTIVGNTTGINLTTGTGSTPANSNNIIIANNIFKNLEAETIAVSLLGDGNIKLGGYGSGANVIIDNNIGYATTGSTDWGWVGSIYTWSGIKSICTYGGIACNANDYGSPTDPLLDSSYIPLVGSPAIGHGRNFSSVNDLSVNNGPCASGCADKAGTLRGTTWDIGAYEYTSGDDVIAPEVTIKLPVEFVDTYSTSSSSLNISGTASDNVEVTSVTWSNNGSAPAACSGTTDWSKTGITLTSGVNVITIRAYDAAGLYGSDVLTVTYNPPDTTPDDFHFTDEVNVPISTVKTSAPPIPVVGFTGSVAVTVSGGTYSKNGLAYTADPGTAVSGDTFTVRQTSSASYSVSTSVILSVGGVTDAYTVTTTSGNIVTSPVLPNGLIMGNGVVMR